MVLGDLNVSRRVNESVRDSSHISLDMEEFNDCLCVSELDDTPVFSTLGVIREALAASLRSWIEFLLIRNGWPSLSTLKPFFFLLASRALLLCGKS